MSCTAVLVKRWCVQLLASGLHRLEMCGPSLKMSLLYVVSSFALLSYRAVVLLMICFE